MVTPMTPSLTFDFDGIQCDDLGPGNYNHMKERGGSQWPETDIYEWIMKNPMPSDNFNFKLISSPGRFAVERHEENNKDRGDDDNVKQRSIEMLGVPPELRNPPWLVQHPTLGVDDEFLGVNWRTLFDATEGAWQSDIHRSNRAVQVTLATSICGTRLHRRDLPSDAANFLVDCGNLLNKESTATNILETWRSTRTVEAAFPRKKEKLKWTLSSLGAAGFTNRQLEVANDLFQGR